MSAAPSNTLINPNAEWLNFRGTWVTNILLTVALGLLFSAVPGVTRETAWTLTNLTYNIVRSETHGMVCGGILTLVRCSLPSSSFTGFVGRHLI